MKIVKLLNKGKITIPKHIRDAHQWNTKIEFSIQELDNGILLKVVESGTSKGTKK